LCVWVKKLIISISRLWIGGNPDIQPGKRANASRIFFASILCRHKNITSTFRGLLVLVFSSGFYLVKQLVDLHLINISPSVNSDNGFCCAGKRGNIVF